jgi:hypothetical protein
MFAQPPKALAFEFGECHFEIAREQFPARMAHEVVAFFRAAAMSADKFVIHSPPSFVSRDEMGVRGRLGRFRATFGPRARARADMK